MFDKIATLFTLGFAVFFFALLIWKGPSLLDQKVKKGEMPPEKAAKFRPYVRPLFAFGLVLAIVLLVVEIRDK